MSRIGNAPVALPEKVEVAIHAGEISIKGEPGLAALQRSLLLREGVRFDRRERIDWDRFGWRGPRG